jgi:regulatory protein YycI of two-component signal transduction system YycFG
MKIKPIHIILIIIAIIILLFSFKEKNESIKIEKNKVEEILNKEEINISPMIQEEIPQVKEDTYEERVKKMYELLPPYEIFVE